VFLITMKFVKRIIREKDDRYYQNIIKKSKKSKKEKPNPKKGSKISQITLETIGCLGVTVRGRFPVHEPLSRFLAFQLQFERWFNRVRVNIGG
jgi:hypothetical protein